MERATKHLDNQVREYETGDCVIGGGGAEIEGLDITRFQEIVSSLPNQVDP